MECVQSFTSKIEKFFSRFPDGGALHVPLLATNLVGTLSVPGSAVGQIPRFSLSTLALGRIQLLEAVGVSLLDWLFAECQMERRPFDVHYGPARHAMFAAREKAGVLLAPSFWAALRFLAI